MHPYSGRCTHYSYQEAKATLEAILRIDGSDKDAAKDLREANQVIKSHLF